MKIHTNTRHSNKKSGTEAATTEIGFQRATTQETVEEERIHQEGLRVSENWIEIEKVLKDRGMDESSNRPETAWQAERRLRLSESAGSDDDTSYSLGKKFQNAP